MEIIFHDIKKYVGLVHPKLYLITCLFIEHFMWTWPLDAQMIQIQSPCPQGAYSLG